MKSKMMTILAAMFILVMVVTACSNVSDEATPAAGDTGVSTEDTMDKEDMMDEESDTNKEDMMDEDSDMEKEDMMDENSDMDKHDDKMDEDSDMEKDDMMDEDKDMETMSNQGSMAPDFKLTDINGNVHQLSDYKGQKVYIKYWASWCSICLAGLSEIDELSAETNDYLVLTIVTPGANGEQSQEDFTKWFNGLDYKNMNVLFDTDGQIAKELNVRAFPTSVFIGSDVVLIQALPGQKSNDEINAKIDTFY